MMVDCIMSHDFPPNRRFYVSGEQLTRSPVWQALSQRLKERLEKSWGKA
jgi:hypothetical protein